MTEFFNDQLFYFFRWGSDPDRCYGERRSHRGLLRRRWLRKPVITLRCDWWSLARPFGPRVINGYSWSFARRCVPRAIRGHMLYCWLLILRHYAPRDMLLTADPGFRRNVASLRCRSDSESQDLITELPWINAHHRDLGAVEDHFFIVGPQQELCEIGIGIGHDHDQIRIDGSGIINDSTRES